MPPLKSPPRPILTVDAVRKRAETIPHCETLSESANSVCFMLPNVPARVTVYCDTGTVATTRVLNSEARHVFRKQNSLDMVEKILRNPPELASISWDLVQPSTNQTTELADVGSAILRGERDKLVQYLDALEISHSSIQSHSTNNTPNTPSSGLEFQFSLAELPMKHVDQCLSDIHQMGKLVRGVATNGLGTVFLYGNGGVAYTPNIPRALYHRLSQLRQSKLHAGRPRYVSLGTRERYFCNFFDGTFSYKGPKALDRELKKLTQPPRSVSFGNAYDTFFLVLHDGTCKYQGRGIPEDLVRRIGNETQLATVNLGPHHEWFVRFQDGTMEYGGGTRELHANIQELLNDGRLVNFLDFGENGSYFVSYD